MQQINALRFVTLPLYLLLISCGGGSDSSEPPTPPVTVAPVPIVVQVTDAHRIDAARLLTQASFGPRFAEVEQTANFLANNSVAAWIDAQASLPTTLHYPVARALHTGLQSPMIAQGKQYRLESWWRATLYGEDQLRQKVAFALSQLFVVSEKSQLVNFQLELANYYDILLRHSFGNYRELMAEITKSPVMGLYLSMLGNEKPQPERNIRPDENFARELMQLFTLGLHQLNNDGSFKLDSQGQLLPTYNQTVVEAYAHVFTGWHFAGKTVQTWPRFFLNADFIRPMALVSAYHDQGQKILLDGYVVPAGTAGDVALDIALDSLFMHPNVPPFVAKHLIAHLVTSNPSPAYVNAVANAFIDNGQGVRGDMLALIKATLTHPEARAASYYQQEGYGRVKQPLVRATQLLRSLIPVTDRFTQTEPVFRELTVIDYFTAQAPLSAPSVFNFFMPDHQVSGELAERNLVTPEFQLMTSSNIIRNSNFAAYMLYHPDAERFRQRLALDFAPFTPLVNNQTQIDALLNYVNFALLQGQMSEPFAQVLRDYDRDIRGAVDADSRVRELLMLIFSSPQFAVQR